MSEQEIRRGPSPERELLLNRIQAWGFVLAAIAAVLTFPVAGVIFGLAAVALGYRTPTPWVRQAGLAMALIALVVVVGGLGPADGGGLID